MDNTSQRRKLYEKVFRIVFVVLVAMSMFMIGMFVQQEIARQEKEILNKNSNNQELEIERLKAENDELKNSNENVDSNSGSTTPSMIDYTSTAMGISVQYPSGWQVNEISETSSNPSTLKLSFGTANVSIVNGLIECGAIGGESLPGSSYSELKNITTNANVILVGSESGRNIDGNKFPTSSRLGYKDGDTGYTICYGDREDYKLTFADYEPILKSIKF